MKLIIMCLINYTANVNAGDRYKVTPLHVASLHGHSDCVRLFLDTGANVNAGTMDYNRPGVYKSRLLSKFYSPSLKNLLFGLEFLLKMQILLNLASHFSKRYDSGVCTEKSLTIEKVQILVNPAPGPFFPLPPSLKLTIHFVCAPSTFYVSVLPFVFQDPGFRDEAIALYRLF